MVDWVLLSYRVPREPSTPRIAIWRRLKRLGVAKLGDGLVGLPCDARTLEHLEWLAESVGEAGGSSTLWRARLTTRRQERDLVASLTAERAAEYAAIVEKADAATSAGDVTTRGLRTLRRELREVRRRDFFPPRERETAEKAVTAYAAALAITSPDAETVR
jgi:hypothetical protein